MAKTPGKKVFKRRYFHTAALDTLERNIAKRIDEAAEYAQLNIGEDFNVVRLEDDSESVTLLKYQDFFEPHQSAHHRIFSCV